MAQGLAGTRPEAAATVTATLSTVQTPSFWLDQLGSPEPRPTLAGAVDADVCIVGGGFTGLWTAYELRRADPERSVVVLEGEYVGFGASGRNGGWVLGRLSGNAAAWRRLGGADAPASMAQAIQHTVAEVGAAIEQEGIDCDWHQGGSLKVAQGGVQRDRLRTEAERLRRDGVSGWRLLDGEEVRERVAVEEATGALFTPYCARVQPAKLVTGLAAAVERGRARIFEHSRALSITDGEVRTARGRVTAPHVVLATEGYTANLPDRHRALLPLNSAMIITEPLGEDLWSGIGWADAETMLDGSHLYTYSQRTADGRIAIGGRGVPYRFGSRTDREGAVPPGTVRELRQRLAALFPSLEGVPISRAWHGVLGVSRDWCPRVGRDPRTGLWFAGGYAGEGVAAANLAGRTLRDLILGRDSELTRLPWVADPARNWEPEPMRFIGARGIYRIYREADRAEGRSGRPSHLAAVADTISGR